MRMISTLSIVAIMVGGAAAIPMTHGQAAVKDRGYRPGASNGAMSSHSIKNDAARTDPQICRRA
jgi:hypothetical protein